LIVQARQMQVSLEGLRQQVAPVLDRVRQQPDGGAGLNGIFKEFHEEVTPQPDPAALTRSVVEVLGRWVNSGDCPLPELFRRCRGRPRQCAATSTGTSPDAWRQLEAAGYFSLPPWPAPLYPTPNPAYALLVGHEIVYYASLKRGGSR